MPGAASAMRATAEAVERRAVAQHDERPVRVDRERGEPGVERRRLAVAPCVAHDGAGAVQVDVREDLARVGAQDDDPLTDPGAGDGRESALQHRHALDGVQLLDASEPAPLPRGKHDGCDHTSRTIESAIWSVRPAARL